MTLSNQKNSASNVHNPVRQHSQIFRKKQELNIETIVNTAWVSTFLALILTIPSLVIFMGIYFSTGNILLGVLVGFGLHFVGFSYSDKISKGLLRLVS
jgi:hypothetical protein